MVDQSWAVDQLQTFIGKIDQMSDLYRTIHVIGGGDHPRAEDLQRQISELEGDLLRQEPAVQIVMDAVDPELRNYER